MMTEEVSKVASWMETEKNDKNQVYYSEKEMFRNELFGRVSDHVSWAWIDRVKNKRLYQKSYDDNDDYAFFGLGRKKLQGDGAVYGPQK